MNDRKVSVSAGRMLTLSGGVAATVKFNVEDTDSFDRWSKRRGELLADANVSAAKQARGYPGVGIYAGINPCNGGVGYGPYGPFARSWGTWDYNPYYGLGTYIPCQGSVMSPYGFNYWSPMAVYGAFFSPNPAYVFAGPTRGQPGGSPAGYVAPGNRGYSGAPAMHSGGVGSVGAAGGGSGARGGGGGGSSAGAVSNHGGGGGGGRK